MVEVFVTNVTETRQANRIVEQIQLRLPYHTATFDLEDCDRILRVVATGTPVDPSRIIGLLQEFGFRAEVLPDEVSTASILY
ncbi:hypothetical protein GCM10027347_22340 [Larkinella harenae]